MSKTTHPHEYESGKRLGTIDRPTYPVGGASELWCLLTQSHYVQWQFASSGVVPIVQLAAAVVA